jgi:hypothetical protein
LDLVLGDDCIHAGTVTYSAVQRPCNT